MHRGTIGPLAADRDLQLPQAGHGPDFGIQGPQPIRVLVEGRVGLGGERHGAGEHLIHLGLAQLSGPALQLHVHGALAGQADEPANAHQGKQENSQGDQHFQKGKACARSAVFHGKHHRFDLSGERVQPRRSLSSDRFRIQGRLFPSG